MLEPLDETAVCARQDDLVIGPVTSFGDDFAPTASSALKNLGRGSSGGGLVLIADLLAPKSSVSALVKPFN